MDGEGYGIPDQGPRVFLWLLVDLFLPARRSRNEQILYERERLLLGAVTKDELGWDSLRYKWFSQTRVIRYGRGRLAAFGSCISSA